MQFNELIAELGKKTGLDFLTPNEDGLCEIDTEFATVNIQDVSEMGMVLLTGIVCPVPDEPSRAFLMALLEANFMFQRTRGATLSIDTEANVVMLARYERLSDLDGDRLAVILANFLDTMREWTLWQEPDAPKGLEGDGESVIRL